MKTTEGRPTESSRDSASHPRLVQQFGAVWVAIRNGITAIGATRKDAIQGVEIQYTGHVPCPKCGMTHWMHGPCIGRPWDWIEANPRKALRMVGVSFREQDESKDLRVHVVDEDPRYPKMCVNGELNFGVSINAETGMPEGGRECICAARADDFCICDLLPSDQEHPASEL